INGIGTRLYGHADEQSDGTYTATKWVVFIFIPIIPLRSYRVFSKEDGVLSTEYQLMPIPLDKKQVLKTYLITAAIAVALLVAIL
ncbi:MAG: hypothetical protein LBE13_05555, partial [Bacteroidales bacterium]|nr:hypothetical protein [Bacteroidales bacterium]